MRKRKAKDPRIPKGIYRCRPPRMTMHFGRAWDTVDVILLDGTHVEGYQDYTWGTNFYFFVEDPEGNCFFNKEPGKKYSCYKADNSKFMERSNGSICIAAYDLRETRKS